LAQDDRLGWSIDPYEFWSAFVKLLIARYILFAMAVALATCAHPLDQSCQKASLECSLRDRQDSLDSTVAPSRSSFASSSSDGSGLPTNGLPEDDRSEPSSAQVSADDAAVHSDSEAEKGACFVEAPADQCMQCMYPEPLEHPMVSPGMCIRVWRRKMSPARMEWSEVIQRSLVDGNDFFICETLNFELFIFSPELVRKGADDIVERYEISREDMQKASLRQQEVARLHSALSSESRLEKLPSTPAYAYPGFIVAPSQFHVKCTVLGDVTPDKSRNLQETVQQGLLQQLARCHRLQSPSHSPKNHGRQSAPSATDATESGWQRWTRTVKSRFSSNSVAEDSKESSIEFEEGRSSVSEKVAKHIPDLCPECIRMCTWCSGALHLPAATSCIDDAVSLMHSPVLWVPSEAGVEAEIEHHGERLLLQVRPSLFCIPDTDVKLFGSVHHSR